METLSTQWILAILAVYVIQLLKDSKFPIFNNAAGTPNAILAAITAFISATGIAYASNFEATSGTFTLTVTGINAGSIAAGTWAWGQQYLWQWLGWKLVKGKV